MPVFAFFFGLVTMSSIGLPMLNGFVGEFLILLGAFLAHPWYAVVAASGVVLAAAYMLWMFRRVMFGPVDNPENRKLIDLDLREKVGAGGDLDPDRLDRRRTPIRCCAAIEPSVSALLQDVHARAALAAPAPAPRAAVALAGAARSAREPARAQPLGARPGRGGRHAARCSCWSARCCSRAARRSSAGRLTESYIGSVLALRLDRSRSALATYMAADIARSGAALVFDVGNPMFQLDRSRRSSPR